jgi:branched-chain amino acid transport system permease protein
MTIAGDMGLPPGSPAAETPAVLPPYRVERATPASRIGVALAALVLVVLASAPSWMDRASMRLVVEICCYLTLAQMWNLLAGYAGLVSVGQQAFVGLGGYVLFVLAINVGVNPLFAVPLAGAVAAAFAVPTALMVFRLRGAHFAIGTWVVAEVYRLAFAQVSALGGGSGMSLPAGVVRTIAADRATRETMIYYAGLVLAVVAVLLVYGLLRSRAGLALTAIRDSEPASNSLGVNTYAMKFGVYVVAAFSTGAVGGLLFLQKLRITPDAAFGVTDWTAFVIFIVVIGGIGTIEGPILGTLLFFLMREMLAGLGAWYLVALGLVAVIVMLRAPRGLVGLIARRFDVEMFPVRRRLRIETQGPKS